VGQPIDGLDASTLSRDRTYSRVEIRYGPDRGKLPGVHPPVALYGARRLVFVFRVGEIPATKHQTGALRGESLQQSRDFERG